METKGLWQVVGENVVFVVECLGIALLLFLAAYLVEKYVQKRSGASDRILSTRKIAMIGMFSAISGILMTLEIPVPFAPPFYKLDFSELPALIGAFAFGPVAGLMIEFCKVLLKLFIKGTTTAFVGDFANFAVGCSFLLPASIIYYFHKSKKSAIVGAGVGTLIMTVFGTAFNAVYLLPKFMELYGMQSEEIIAMGAAVNPMINNITTLVMFAVAPLNLIKGGAVSLITILIYKKLSPILKAGRTDTRLKMESKS